MILYSELLAQQEAARRAFGTMLLSWRRRNGWTQYTACSWAEAAGFETISYGNLSVIEQGKAGELRQKAFFQLQELNRRIAQKDWGPVASQEIKQRLEAATPLGDEEVPVWGALEFWACYCGLREVPEHLRQLAVPVIGQRKAAELSARWRNHVRRAVQESPDDALTVLERILKAVPDEHRRLFGHVLTGAADYRSEEVLRLWVEADTYLPDQWISAALP